VQRGGSDQESGHGFRSSWGFIAAAMDQDQESGGRDLQGRGDAARQRLILGRALQFFRERWVVCQSVTSYNIGAILDVRFEGMNGGDLSDLPLWVF
jgi:hypothetical protein